MDIRMKAIFDACGYGEDPNAKLFEKIFADADFSNPQKLLDAKNSLVIELFREKQDLSSVKILRKTIRNFNDLEGFATKVDAGIFFIRPIIISGGIELPSERLFISNLGAYLGANVILNNVTIEAPTFIDDSAIVKHTTIQDPVRCNFIGKNATINVPEFCGCFVSGGKFSADYVGRKKTYMHASSMNNMLVGAGTGIASGTHVHNHPQSGMRSAICDLGDTFPCRLRTEFLPDEDEYRKIPTFIGIGVGIGINCGLHSGSVIGAHSQIPAGQDIDGRVYKANDTTLYEKFDRRKKFSII